MSVSNLFIAAFRVYVAGVRMPCSSVSISSAFNSPPTATVALPPDSRLFGIGRLDRVPVQVFVNDVFSGSRQGFILIFDGEISSFGYQSTPMGREIVVNAHSAMAFLDDLNIRLMNNLEDYAIETLPASELKTLGVAGGSLSYPASLFTQGITHVGGDLIRTPTEFVQNIATYLSRLGTGEDPWLNTKLGEYYKAHAARLKFKSRIPMLPFYDDRSPTDKTLFPILEGMQTQSAVALLLGLANQSNTGTLLSFLNLIAADLEYEVCMPTAPRCDGGNLYSMIFKPILYDALPPACNIMFRSHVDTLRLNEQVYGVPTRIRTRDAVGPMGTIDPNSWFTKYATIDYFPTDLEEKDRNNKEANINYFAKDWLDTEQYTGPFLYDTSIPRWFSYAGDSDAKEFIPYKDRMHQHMFTLKRYEHRNMQVSTAFNPFITPGFPGVVFDSWQNDNSDFTFAGQVMAVSHTLSKHSARTSVMLSFARSLRDESPDGMPLVHGHTFMKDINRNVGKIGQIYKKILGCDAVAFSAFGKNTYGEEHGSPAAAYAFNRRGICTFDEYLSFMDSTGTKGQLSVLSGDYFEHRYDKGLRGVLQDIALEYSKMEIYA